MDWKDQLASLRGGLEEPSEPEVQPADEGKNNITQTSVLNVLIDKKGRNGKVATIIEGFTIPEKNVEEIARNLKQKLGVGGSVRGNEILIQGDRKKEVTQLLRALNFRVK